MSDLLNPNEMLVYIKSSTAFANTDGAVYVAQLSKTFFIDNVEYGEFLLLNDPEALDIPFPRTAFAPLSSIVSNRSPHLLPGISPKSFYHYSPDLITATSFISPGNSCTETSRSGYGSGVYGIYSDNIESANYIKSSNQYLYTISCDNPYYLQDMEHGCSLTIASMQTNNYIDMILPLIFTVDDINSVLSFNDIEYLLILWNTVFYRTSSFITKSDLFNILYTYISNKLSSPSSLYHLPINDILLYCGFDGIISTDIYNNIWTRGCVSFTIHSSYNVIGTSSTY